MSDLSPLKVGDKVTLVYDSIVNKYHQSENILERGTEGHVRAIRSMPCIDPSQFLDVEFINVKNPDGSAITAFYWHASHFKKSND